MSAGHTPRSELSEGDRVRLTGASWAGFGLEGRELEVRGSGPMAHVFDAGDNWYIRDPKMYPNGQLLDHSVTRVEDET